MGGHEWAEELVGVTLADRYQVESVIGGGGMGVVLAATHLKLDRPVAIKMMHRVLSRDATIIERFHQEAKAAASVGSAGVAQVIDLDEDEEHGPFLVMERLNGESLVEVLKRGRVETTRAIWIVSELLDVLGAVHARGIVHRDLKPPNVFLHQDEAGDEVVKVLDFGIAKVKQRHLTMTGEIVGTPRFMAPEQALGDHVDHRCDIYAAGLLLYCALTGLPPYSSIPAHQVMARISQGPPSLRSLRPDLPEPLLDAIDRGLAADPADRYDSAPEMADALRALVPDYEAGERPLPARSPSQDEEPPAASATRKGVGPARIKPAEETAKPGLAAPTRPSRPNKERNAKKNNANDLAGGPTRPDRGSDRPLQGKAAPDENTEVETTEADNAMQGLAEPSIVLPKRSLWRPILALLSIVGAIGVTWFLMRPAPAPIVRASLESEGPCQVPNGEVELVRVGRAFIFEAVDSDLQIEITPREGGRYWVATGTPENGATAEIRGGSGPRHLEVRSLDLEHGVDVEFHRVDLTTPSGICVIRGELLSR